MSYLKYWFPVFVYSGIIFFLSSLPADVTKQMPFTVWDKLEHAIEYALLGFLVFRALRHTSSLSRQAIWIVAVGFCICYGLSDEFHQSFVPGREVSRWDALADGIGGMIGATVYLMLKHKEIKHGSH